MSKKETTLGEEFENLMSFVIKYKVNMKEERKRIKQTTNKVCALVIPDSQLRLKAISIGMTENDYCQLLAKQKIPFANHLDNKEPQPYGYENAKVETKRIFHPTKEDEKRDKKLCQKFIDKGANFETIQKDLSLVSPFKEFLSVNGTPSFVVK